MVRVGSLETGEATVTRSVAATRNVGTATVGVGAGSSVFGCAAAISVSFDGYGLSPDSVSENTAVTASVTIAAIVANRCRKECLEGLCACAAICKPLFGLEHRIGC